MARTVLVIVIGICRAAGGLVAYARPATFARHGSLGGAAQNADARYVVRLFGARDIVVGGWAIFAPRSAAVTWIGALCDCLDTASALVAKREGKDSRWVRASASVTGLFAAAGIVAALWPTCESPKRLTEMHALGQR
jgi:hypothetical protein